MSFLFYSNEETVSPSHNISKTNIKEANGHIQALFEKVNNLELQRDELLEQTRKGDADVDSLKSSFTVLQESAAQKDLAITSLQLTVAEKDAIIENLQDKIFSSDDAVQKNPRSDDAEDVSELNATIEGLKINCNSLEEKHSAGDLVIQDLKLRCQVSEEKHSAGDLVVQDLKFQLQQNEEEIISLKAQLAASEENARAIIKAKEEDCSSLENQLASFVTKLASNESQLTKAEKQIDVLKNILQYTSTVESLLNLLKQTEEFHPLATAHDSVAEVDAKLTESQEDVAVEPSSIVVESDVELASSEEVAPSEAAEGHDAISEEAQILEVDIEEDATPLDSTTEPVDEASFENVLKEDCSPDVEAISDSVEADAIVDEENESPASELPNVDLKREDVALDVDSISQPLDEAASLTPIVDMDVEKESTAPDVDTISKPADEAPIVQIDVEKEQSSLERERDENAPTLEVEAVGVINAISEPVEEASTLDVENDEAVSVVNTTSEPPVEAQLVISSSEPMEEAPIVIDDKDDLITIAEPVDEAPVMDVVEDETEPAVNTIAEPMEAAHGLDVVELDANNIAEPEEDAPIMDAVEDEPDVNTNAEPAETAIIVDVDGEKAVPVVDTVPEPVGDGCPVAPDSSQEVIPEPIEMSNEEKEPPKDGENVAQLISSITQATFEQPEEDPDKATQRSECVPESMTETPPKVTAIRESNGNLASPSNDAFVDVQLALEIAEKLIHTPGFGSGQLETPPLTPENNKNYTSNESAPELPTSPKETAEFFV